MTIGQKNTSKTNSCENLHENKIQSGIERRVLVIVVGAQLDSDTPVPGTRAHLKMDHAVKTSKTKPWDKLRFENEELETLYQRYTLKMQRFSVIGVVSLFVIFCMTMMTLSYVFNRLLEYHVRAED